MSVAPGNRLQQNEMKCSSESASVSEETPVMKLTHEHKELHRTVVKFVEDELDEPCEDAIIA